MTRTNTAILVGLCLALAVIALSLAGCEKQIELKRTHLGFQTHTEGCYKGGFCYNCGLSYHGHYRCGFHYSYSCNPGVRQVTEDTWQVEYYYKSEPGKTHTRMERETVDYGVCE